MKNADILIAHILDAIRKIKSYIADKTFDDFSADEELQDAVVRNLEIIGEASRGLPKNLKAQIDLPWDEISSMRNKIVHDYFELNIQIIWKTATDDILALEEKLSSKNHEDPK